MKDYTAAALVILLTTLSLPALAEKSTINERQHSQKNRIEQGLKSGSLNRKEATRMIKQQQAIQAKEKAYRADGKLTAKERLDLQTDLNRTSQNVYSQKHDVQSRR